MEREEFKLTMERKKVNLIANWILRLHIYNGKIQETEETVSKLYKKIVNLIGAEIK